MGVPCSKTWGFLPPSYLDCTNKVTPCLLMSLTERWQDRYDSSLLNPCWQHQGFIWAAESVRGVCPNQVYEFEIRVWEPEFLYLGYFSTKFYAVYVAQNWENMSACKMAACHEIDSLASMWEGQQALVNKQWDGCAYLFSTICNFV